MAAGEYAALVLASSPAVYWKCQEAAAHLQDSSGNGIHATTSTPVIDYSQLGPTSMGDRSIILHGGSKITASTTAGSAVNNITYEAFINVNIDQGNDSYIVYNGNPSLTGSGICWRTSTQNFAYLVGNVAFGPAFAGATVLATWHHIAIVRSAGTWIYYRDGVVDTTNAGSSAPNVPVGQFQLFPSVSQQFQMSHVAYYETALSAATIASHYLAASSMGSGSII